MAHRHHRPKSIAEITERQLNNWAKELYRFMKHNGLALTDVRYIMKHNFGPQLADRIADQIKERKDRSENKQHEREP